MKIYAIDYHISDVTSSIAKLTDNGHDCVLRVAEYEPANTVPCHVRTFGNRIDRIAHKVLAFVGDTHMMHSTRPTANIIDDICDIRPDVIHIANLHKDYVNLPLLAQALIKLSIPTAVTLHPDFPTIDKLPALIKRRAFNRNILECILDSWDNLVAVAPNEHVAGIATKGFFRLHPVYTIPHDGYMTSTSYEQLFYNM